MFDDDDYHVTGLGDEEELHDEDDYVMRFPRTAGPFAWDELPRFDPARVERFKWLINSFLAEGNIQLVFGERGSFKSTLLLVAAKAVSAKETFLGMKTRRRKVLVLDYENPPDVIKTRCTDLGLNLPENQWLVIWDRFGQRPLPKPNDRGLQLFVRSCIAETGYGPWIIFDSFASLLKPGEGGEFTGQVAPIYQGLRTLADLRASITVLDHSRKYDKNIVYGGQDKEAKVDSIHNLTVFPNKTTPTNPIVRVDSWHKRAAPKGIGSFSFEVLSEPDLHGDWHIVGLAPAADPLETSNRENVQMLQKIIRANPRLGQDGLSKVAAKLGVPRDQATEILKAGEGKHWTVTTGGHNKKTYLVIEN